MTLVHLAKGTGKNLWRGRTKYSDLELEGGYGFESLILERNRLLENARSGCIWLIY